MKSPIDFDQNPLIPAVVQDDDTHDVLMVGFMNQLAFEHTMQTGFVHFWSRSRNQLWKKGETSGNTLDVVSIALNCENNSLLILVHPQGATCHTGHYSCYHRQILPDGSLRETSAPLFDPALVYGDDDRSLSSLWFGAYRYLRDHDLTSVSGTSRLLHTGPAPYDRIADELEELAGVLDGSHRHSDLESDLLLEGSQILYWLAVSSVLQDIRYEPDFDSDTAPDRNETTSIVAALRQQAIRWRGDDIDSLEQALQQTTQLVAKAMKTAGIAPQQLLERDLADLRSQEYLQDYFDSANA